MKNLFDYTGKRCLFAGCYSGMGEAAAQIVSSLGGSVVAVDIKRPSGFDFEAFHEVDLADPAAIEQMVSEVAAAGPIDRVFYCAGLPGTFPVVQAISVNFLGLRHTIEQCVPHMPRDGAAVCISSSAALGYMGQLERATPLLDTDGFAAGLSWVEENLESAALDGYVFPKCCAVLYTLRRAATLTPETGIRLNVTTPGPTDTPMMPAFVAQSGQKFMDAYPKPIGRNSTSEEQGWPLAFLNSDAASYITGENLFTDGGGAAAMLTGQMAPDLSLIGQD